MGKTKKKKRYCGHSTSFCIHLLLCPGAGLSCAIAHARSKHFVDFGNRLADEQVAALVPRHAAGDIGRIVTSPLRLFGREIPGTAACKLDEKGLACPAPCAHLISVIKKKLKGVRGKGDITELQDMHLKKAPEGYFRETFHFL